MSSRYLLSIGAILLASFLWGVGYFLRKIILGDIHAVALNFGVCVVVSILMILFFRLDLRKVYASFWRHPWQFLCLAFLGVVVGTTSLLLGLSRLDLGITTILEKLQPVFTVLLAWFVLRERISGYSWLFMLVALGASYFVSVKDWVNFSLDNFDVVGVGYVFYYYGLKFVSAGVAGFLELLTPVTSLALGILFLGEQLVLSQWMGIFFLIVAVYYIARKN